MRLVCAYSMQYHLVQVYSYILICSQIKEVAPETAGVEKTSVDKFFEEDISVSIVDKSLFKGNNKV